MPSCAPSVPGPSTPIPRSSRAAARAVGGDGVAGAYSLGPAVRVADRRGDAVGVLHEVEDLRGEPGGDRCEGVGDAQQDRFQA